MDKRPAALLTVALLLLLLPLPTASAYEEAEAGLLWSQVQEVSHSPVQVPPHTQWNGTLVLRPGHHVVSAQYQICRVGQACFAPPAPATREGADTFSFNTRDYQAGGHPVDYQAGWRIGVQWILTESTANGTTMRDFPQGPSASDPACVSDQAALVCQERHYLAFDMMPAPKATPAPSPPVVVVLLALLARLRGARTRHA